MISRFVYVKNLMNLDKLLRTSVTIWNLSQENRTLYANYKGTDQPAHPSSLISAFVILLFTLNIEDKRATCKIAIF